MNLLCLSFTERRDRRYSICKTRFQNLSRSILWLTLPCDLLTHFPLFRLSHAFIRTVTKLSPLRRARGSHLLRGVLVSFQCLGVIDEKTSSCRRSKPILAEINKCLLRSYFPLSAQYSRQCLLSTADALGLVLRHPSLGSTPSPVWRGPSSIRDATTFAHQLCAARAESRVTVRRERHCKRADGADFIY